MRYRKNSNESITSLLPELLVTKNFNLKPLLEMAKRVHRGREQERCIFYARIILVSMILRWKFSVFSLYKLVIWNDPSLVMHCNGPFTKLHSLAPSTTVSKEPAFIICVLFIFIKSEKANIRPSAGESPRKLDLCFLSSCHLSLISQILITFSSKP